MADYELPMTSVVRVIKSKLPSSVTLSREAKVALAKSAGVFVYYLTAVANEYCKEGRRQTLLANDVFDALKEIDFEPFVEPLKRALEEQRADQQAKKKAKLNKGGAMAVSPTPAEADDEDDDDVESSSSLPPSPTPLQQTPSLSTGEKDFQTREVAQSKPNDKAEDEGDQ